MEPLGEQVRDYVSRTRLSDHRRNPVLPPNAYTGAWIPLHQHAGTHGARHANARRDEKHAIRALATWLLLAVLAADVATRGIGTTHGISSLTYALTFDGNVSGLTASSFSLSTSF